MINNITIKKAKNGWIVNVNPNMQDDFSKIDFSNLSRTFERFLPPQDELHAILDEAKAEAEIKNAMYVFINNNEMIAFLDLLLNKEITA